MILFDWRCAKHGVFESSHAICPQFGCDSATVVKVFLKAPGKRSNFMKRFDAGLRENADAMGLANLRTARADEAAYGGEAGKKLLWGNETQKAMGKSFSELASNAAQQNTQNVPPGIVAAANSGITQRALPQAKRTVHKADTA